VFEVEGSKEPIPGFDIRYTEPDDVKHLIRWLSNKDTLQWFPMREPAEIEDSAHRWVGFCRYKASLTATINGEPCGLTTLYLQAYKTLMHQCEFGIIVDEEHRGKGVGSQLMRNGMNLAKNYFKIELLHLQVHAENPAMNLYRRFGFREFGRQTHWEKDQGVYVGRVFMERFL